jgi:hypothetical protein
MYKYVEKLIENKKKGEIKRLGTLFSTKNKNYFYDTGTGKVVELDNDGLKIMKCLFDEEIVIKNVEDLICLSTRDNVHKFNQEINEYKILQGKEPQRFYSANYYENFENKVENELEQIILELTGKCNLRCKYCIYNDAYIYNRSFNNYDMTQEIAKAGVDYLYEHSRNSKKKAITFYGGEPLIKFDLLKWTIDYARKLFKDDVAFSLTTNLTLVTEDIASYFGTVPNLTVVASLDGPEIIQNKCRVYADGRETFIDAIRGLKLITEKMRDNDTSSIMINAVYTPPYSMEGIHSIMEFFDSLDFLPENIGVQITYPTSGSYEVKNDYEIKDERDKNPLWEWIKEATKEKSLTTEKNRKYATSMFNALTRIHNRFLVDEPVDYYPFHSCCIPGVRRLYINSEGNFYVCEKIGDSPSIGDVRNGINIKNVKDYYIDGYNKNMINTCKNCWAIRLCHSCYVDRYDTKGFRQGFSFNSCDNEREAVKNELILYHSLLENNPEKIEEISKIEIF